MEGVLSTERSSVLRSSAKGILSMRVLWKVFCYE